MTEVAILTRNTSANWPDGSFGVVSWQAADQTSTFWASTPNPSRITIPASLDGQYVEFFTTVSDDSNTSEDYLVRLLKNGSTVALTAIQDTEEHPRFALSFGVFLVAEDDYFEIELAVFTGTEPINIGLSHFGMATLERLGITLLRYSTDTTITESSPKPNFDDIVSNFESAYNSGTQTITIPAGVDYIIPRLVSFTTNLNTSKDSYWAIKKNGTVVRNARPGVNLRTSAGCFGPIAVKEGDTIVLEYMFNPTGSLTLQATTTAYSVEFLAASV